MPNQKLFLNAEKTSKLEAAMRRNPNYITIYAIRKYRTVVESKEVALDIKVAVITVMTQPWHF